MDRRGTVMSGGADDACDAIHQGRSLRGRLTARTRVAGLCRVRLCASVRLCGSRRQRGEDVLVAALSARPFLIEDLPDRRENFVQRRFASHARFRHLVRHLLPGLIRQPSRSPFLASEVGSTVCVMSAPGASRRPNGEPATRKRRCHYPVVHACFASFNVLTPVVLSPDAYQIGTRVRNSDWAKSTSDSCHGDTATVWHKRRCYRQKFKLLPRLCRDRSQFYFVGSRSTRVGQRSRNSRRPSPWVMEMPHHLRRTSS